jgi:hypothetical protein
MNVIGASVRVNELPFMVPSFLSTIGTFTSFRNFTVGKAKVRSFMIVKLRYKIAQED